MLTHKVHLLQTLAGLAKKKYIYHVEMPEPPNPNKAESQMTLASSRSNSDERKESCLKRRTKTENCLIMLVILLAFVIVGLSVTLSAVIGGFTAKEMKQQAQLEAQSGAHTGPMRKFCTNRECVESAAVILQRIDNKVKPCDDFYHFACGEYVKNLNVPDEKTAITQFSEIHDLLQEKLLLVVQDDITSEDPRSTRLVKNLFKSCMNTDRVEAEKIEPLRRMLHIMGGWPVVEGQFWSPSRFSWTEAIYTNRKLGYSVDYLIDFSITVDVKNSSWRIIDIDQPPLGMPSRKYYLKGVNDSDVKAYHQYQVDLAVMLGADNALAQREMLDALRFEIELAKATLDTEDRRNISELYNRMTIRELQRMVPEIPWLQYAQKLLPSDIVITSDEPVVVNVPNYVRQLGKLLTATPKRTVANYMMWRVAMASVGYLSNSVRDLQLKYSKILTGNKSRPPRWKECMGAVSGSLSHAVGSLYAQKFFRSDAKAEADQMVAYIREQFDKILRKVDWMDETTRARALAKSRSIVPHIAYPKELLMESKLTELYQGLHLSDGDLLENMRNLTIFGTNYAFSRLREKVNKQHWRNHGAAAVVNAFYSPLENAIQFPAGILQGIFFNANRPKYLNYGGIGFVIGHEITHGFDDKGRQFDEKGDLFNWWDEATQNKFIEKSKCIIWQYGNYTVPEVNANINGINTQGENIADNGGLKEAYRAYDQWVKDYGPELPLPGLPYTPRQLFWISSAHVWCSKYRPEAMKVRVITGSHSPVQFRVNGPMSNLKEFAKDWACPAGSKMNPTHKCTVW